MSQIRDLLGLKEIGEVFYRDELNLTEIGEIYQRDNLGLNLVWTKSDPLSVNVPGFVYGAQASTSSVSVSTSVCVASVSGGSEPYSYLWERVDVGGTWVISSPNSRQTTFRTNVSANSTASATFRVTVTDNSGAVVISAAVSATVENFGSFL